ncbi:MAG TPA: hypothetical protein VJ508_15070, partial [Saprospiraceae bacterium]|nr:hypothetical protein [Saprospiraceae bacterium]
MARIFYQFLLAGIIILYALSGAARASVISPNLQGIIDYRDVHKQIPVIINLADKIDAKQLLSAVHPPISATAKTYKRGALVKALVEKADVSQRRLTALLSNSGATKITPFWVTNSVAATVSSSLISELISLPEVESIELDPVFQAPVTATAAAVVTEWNITRVNAPTLWNSG